MNEQEEQGFVYNDEGEIGEEEEELISVSGEAPKPSLSRLGQRNTSSEKEIPTDTGPKEPKKEFINIKTKGIIIGISIFVLTATIAILLMYGIKDMKKSKAEEAQETTPVSTLAPPFAYTKSEVKELRSWGYTGDEIEEFQSQEKNVKTLVNESKKAQIEKKAEVNKALVSASTMSGNEQYAYVLANSMYGLPIQVRDKSAGLSDMYTETVAVNYRKLPLQGFQPMIKITVPNTEVTLYHNLSLTDYDLLPETGIVKISMDYYLFDGMKTYSNIEIIEGVDK